MPDALFASRIRMWVVGTENFSVGRAYLMFTATFFAVVAVLVQRESIMAGAHIRADRVAALLLTTSVVYRTFVLVFKKKKKVRNQSIHTRRSKKLRSR